MNSGARTSGTEYQILYGFIIMSYNRLSLMVISRSAVKLYYSFDGSFHVIRGIFRF